MSDKAIVWTDPGLVECSQCRVRALASIASVWPDATGSALPAGWHRGFNRQTRAMVYACSENCRHKLTAGLEKP